MLHDQSCNFLGNTETHSLSECVFRFHISHATSKEMQRHTHQLHVFSGPMISHATSEETQRDSPPGCVLGLMISHAISQETQTHSLPGCI